MDTLTEKDKGGQVVPGTPSITTIPVRFHIYWAGSDKDGSIAGFYYAVVETSVTSGGLLGPSPLPGPKPGDYHFTTRTDTTFIFDVSDQITSRQHAFYVYAVDNKGKPDPTPAHFTFTALDKYPPRPVIDVARAFGSIIALAPDGTPIEQPFEKFVTDSLNPRTEPTDTVPAGSQLDFRWHGEISVAGTYITGYRFKLDETQFNSVDSSVTRWTYPRPGDPAISSGLKLFTLRALDQAQGSGQTTRRFIMNFSPDTWWAGPDPDQFPLVDPDNGIGDDEYNSRSVLVNHWPSSAEPYLDTDPPLPGGTSFGPDSMLYRPSMRMPPGNDFTRRGTFYEIYKDRIYARAEYDTVHMNSWIVLWNGGYDKDSRYAVRADSTDPALHGADGNLLTGLAITPAGRVGSPIGFRSWVVGRLTPGGVKYLPAQSALYPVYEPKTVFRLPRIGGYWRMNQAGTAYAMARAEDADGATDGSVVNPMDLSDEVDCDGCGTPDQQALRRKVIVFYVDKAPALLSTIPKMTGTPSTLTGVPWDITLRAMDLDPYDPTIAGALGGGPTPNDIIRFQLSFFGKDTTGKDVSWQYYEPNGTPYIQRGDAVRLPTVVPGVPFASGPIRMHVEVCDCFDCENNPGRGRCVQYDINFNFVRPAGTVANTPAEAGPGPGSSGGR